MYKEILPIKLKEARKRISFTQQEVADIIGIQRGTLAKYESGKLEPSVETIGKLAECYEVSIDWLFGYVHKGYNQNKELKDREKILKSLEKEAKQEKKAK